MGKLDAFLNVLAAVLLVAVLVAVVVMIWQLAVYLPLGILCPLAVFLAGAASGGLIMFYVAKARTCQMDVIQ